MDFLIIFNTQWRSSYNGTDNNVQLTDTSSYSLNKCTILFIIQM